MAQQHPVHLLRRHRGLDAELVDEQAPQVPVDGEGLGLPAACVQRAHEEGGEPLALREPPQQRHQHRDGLRAAAERQQGLGPFLDGVEPQLVEPSRLGGVDGAGIELREDVPAPERERGVEQVHCARVVGDRVAGRRHQAGELGGVELAVRHRECVTGGLVAQALPARSGCRTVRRRER